MGLIFNNLSPDEYEYIFLRNILLPFNINIAYNLDFLYHQNKSKLNNLGRRIWEKSGLG